MADEVAILTARAIQAVSSQSGWCRSKFTHVSSKS